LKSKEVVKWWEGKRKIYNLFLLAAIILSFIWPNSEQGIGINVNLDILYILFWFLGANIYYSLGAGLDLTFKYYGIELSKPIRYFSLIFGIIISILWTAINFET
jgi:hypothetical protein